MTAAVRARVQALEVSAQAEQAPAVADAPRAASEAGVLTEELVAGFASLVESYRNAYAVSQEEAVRLATQPNAGYEAMILHGPASQVSWAGLHFLGQRDPALAERRWEEVKQVAREELHTGHRAGKVMEGYESRCWDRAQFLAVREELDAAWRPRNGMERQLVDQLAMLQTALLRWQQILIGRTMLDTSALVRAEQGKGRYQPPRVTDYKATEQAGRMVERCHRLLLRTVRALQDLRRQAPPVVVRRAGQVNIGQQQVSMAVAPDEGRSRT
jgi:hypothetical protein